MYHLPYVSIRPHSIDNAGEGDQLRIAFQSQKNTTTRNWPDLTGCMVKFANAEPMKLASFQKIYSTVYGEGTYDTSWVKKKLESVTRLQITFQNRAVEKAQK